MSEKYDPVKGFKFPAHDPHESGTLGAGLDAALELHNREETLLARAEKAEGERAEVKAQLDAERKKIRELLPGFIPHLDMDCEDCEEERPHKCAECEFLFDVIATIEPLPPASPSVPEKKYGYAAVLRQRDEANAACTAMRKALEIACSEFSRRCGYCPHSDGDTCLGTRKCETRLAHEAAYAALSSTCGKDILARLQYLEEAEEFLRQVVTQYPGEEAAAMASGYSALVEAIDAYLNPKKGLNCVHGVPYPAEGDDPASGPWLCNPDGSNPACPNCEPDAWKKEAEKPHAHD